MYARACTLLHSVVECEREDGTKILHDSAITLITTLASVVESEEQEEGELHANDAIDTKKNNLLRTMHSRFSNISHLNSSSHLMAIS